MKKKLLLIALIFYSLCSFAQSTIKGRQIYYIENYSEQQARKYLDNATELDPLEGIYVGDDGYKYSIEKDFDGYRRNPNSFRMVRVYVPGQTVADVGDIVCFIKKGSNTSVFESTYYLCRANWKNGNRTYVWEPFPCVSVLQGATLTSKCPDFDGYGNITGNSNKIYYKVYSPIGSAPTETKVEKWTGSGFALNDGYIVTNYHVVENAKKIMVQGTQDDFNKAVEAWVVATDKINDLAILRLASNPNNIRLPYSVKTTTSDVGESIWVLGYPLTSSMGDEIKLTAGVISAKSGYEGDVSMYQISAAIQPGNSGGPLFDKDGNLIGIVCAHHKGAENANYAIKASYLRNLVESSINNDVLPHNNILSGKELPEKVKLVKHFIYYIVCTQ